VDWVFEPGDHRFSVTGLIADSTATWYAEHTTLMAFVHTFSINLAHTNLTEVRSFSSHLGWKRDINNSDVTIKLKKKSNLPALLTALLTAMDRYQGKSLAVFGNRRLDILGDTTP